MSSTRSSSRRPSRGTPEFLRLAIFDQANLGAVAPTFPRLARRLAGLIPRSPELRILELGAGTGAISTAIGPRLGPGARHFALEREPALLATLEHRAPWATRILGDAADLAVHLAAVGVSGVDVVISALPWSYFAPGVQREILAQVRQVLVPSGLFATIAYVPSRLNPRSRAFRAELHASFEHVEAQAATWANIPPARLLVCHGPRAVPAAS